MMPEDLIPRISSIPARNRTDSDPSENGTYRVHPGRFDTVLKQDEFE